MEYADSTEQILVMKFSLMILTPNWPLPSSSKSVISDASISHLSVKDQEQSHIS